MLILEVTRVSLLLCHILFIGNHWGQEGKLMRRTLLGTILEVFTIYEGLAPSKEKEACRNWCAKLY